MILTAFITGNIFFQDTCRVLKPEIAVRYTGECKNGLAHGKGEAYGIDHYTGSFKKGLPDGKGTYFWSTGEVYEGAWKKGLRNGTGKYSFFVQGKDTVIHGKWLKDKYIGNKKIPDYSVFVRRNIDRFSFTRMGDGSTILFYIYKLGVANSDIEDLSLVGDSGFLIRAPSMTGFEEVDFPFEGKISYRTWNKLHTQQFIVEMEFKIHRPGIWKISISN